MKKIFIAIISLFFLLISGCSSLETAVKKRNIETQTKMSETIWLNPEYITDKTVFLQVKNTSMADIFIERDLKNILTEKGYSGIYVVFDEFSKYLESGLNINSKKDIKLLQDFAEKWFFPKLIERGYLPLSAQSIFLLNP